MDDVLPPPLELVRVFTPDPAEVRLPSGLRVILPSVELWNRMLVIHYVWPVVPNVETTMGTIDFVQGVRDEQGKEYLLGPSGETGGSRSMFRGSITLDEPVHSGTEFVVIPFMLGPVSVKVAI